MHCVLFSFLQSALHSPTTHSALIILKLFAKISTQSSFFNFYHPPTIDCLLVKQCSLYRLFRHKVFYFHNVTR